MIGHVQRGNEYLPIHETVAFTDIEDDGFTVESISITRGRRDEFERTPTGTCTIQMNTQAETDMFFLVGLHIRVRLWNPVLETWTVVFRGNIVNVAWDVDPSQMVTRVELSCADLFDYLANYELAVGTAGFTPPAESEGNIFYEDAQVDDRIRAALGDAGVPSSMTEIFSGNVNVQETVYPPRTSALEVLQDAAEGEWPGVANIYVSKTGIVTFHGRRARFFPDVAEYNINEWNVGDGAEILVNPTDTAQIRSLSYVQDKSLIINAACATPQNIADADIPGQLITDTASIEQYGVHSWSAENLVTAGHKLGFTDAEQECQLFGQYYVDNYAVPRTRVTNIAIRSLRPTDHRAPYTWRVLTEPEISDILHVTTTQPGGGSASTGGVVGDFFIEGIRYDVKPLNEAYDDVTVSFDLSPKAYYDDNPFDSDEFS